jgi:prepilin-type N-terminal cleavage/methylation domain-containing protein
MADHAHRRSTAAGFTLVEMLAALGILLFGVTALIGALSSSVAQRRTTDARLEAAALCEVALHRLQHARPMPRPTWTSSWRPCRTRPPPASPA